MLQTFARIEDGREAETIVIRADEQVPDGDWRPVVVEGLDFDRTAYREAGRETVIQSDRVVRRVVLEPIATVQDDYSGASQAHIEATAQQRNYGSSALLASYVTSTVPAWAAEAQAFVAWRDSVWLAAYGFLGAVKAGEIPDPSMAGLVGRLPPIAWPPS